MKLDRILNRLGAAMTSAPRPLSTIHITSRAVSGLRVSPKDRKIKTHFILPLEPGIIQPSYGAANIQDPDSLAKKIGKGMDILGSNGHGLAFLLPDACQRTFVFSFDTLPKSRAEREQIIEFRVKKQMPMLADDSRLSFILMGSEGRVRVIASIARNSVVKEYEGIFGRMNLRVGVVGVPVLGLYNLGNWPADKNILLINVEENSLSLLAVAGKEIILARQKSSLLPPGGEASLDSITRIITQEIDNTVNFIEDNERLKIEEVRLRFGNIEEKRDLFEGLKGALHLEVNEAGLGLDVPLSADDREILTPLIGQTL